MDHSVLTILDLGIITAYLVIMVLVGVYSVRRIQNTKDYYVAGRSFGPMVLMATVCATIIGGSGLMGRAGVAYTDGFKAVLTAIPYLLGMFIFSGIAGKISDIGMQYGITSIPELFERRFGRAAKITLSVLIAFAMMGTVASQVTATATIIRMLGGEFGLSYEMGALIATVVFMVYTATSGLFGVVYTDVLQFYKAGALGITSYEDKNGIEYYVMIVAHLDGENTVYHVYRALASNGIENARFSEVGSFESDKDFQGFGLITEDGTNDIYMIGLWSPSEGVTFADYAYLYQLNTETWTIGEALQQIHMVSVGGMAGMMGVHFRYGANVYVADDGTLTLSATERNSVLGSSLATNDWIPAIVN